MKKVFVNKFGQLRSGWKIAITLLITAVFIILFTVVILAASVISSLMDSSSQSNLLDIYLIENALSEIQHSALLKFLSRMITPLSMIIATFFVLKVIDKRKLYQVGITPLRTNYKDLLFGLVLGTSSITIIFFVLLSTGNISLDLPLTSPHLSSNILTGLLWLILVGFGEELFGRGYCMTALYQTGDIRVAFIISSAIFSLLHGMNPNISLIPLLNIFSIGLLFAYMFFKTGNLWMPIGYHIAWNYFQGIVFGFPVSGLSIRGIYSTNILYNNILTGGLFGPEGGIITTMVIIVGFFIVGSYSRQRRNLIFGI